MLVGGTPLESNPVPMLFTNALSLESNPVPMLLSNPVAMLFRPLSGY